MGEMAAVPDLHAEEHGEHVASIRPLHRHVVDVGLRVRDRRCEVREQPATPAEKLVHQYGGWHDPWLPS